MSRAKTQLHRRAPWCAVPVAIVCLVLGFAATAQAERFIGVVNPFLHRCDGTQHNADCLSNKDLKRMSRAHLKIVRWGFRWAVAQPGPGPL